MIQNRDMSAQEARIQKILHEFPYPLAAGLNAYLCEENPQRKYENLLSWFDTTIRFLAILSLVRYVQSNVTLDEINDLMVECLDTPEDYHWHTLLEQMSIHHIEHSRELAIVPLRSIFTIDTDGLTDLHRFINNTVELLSLEARSVVISDAEAQARHHELFPRILAFFEHILPLSNDLLVRFLTFRSDGITLSCEKCRGLTISLETIDQPLDLHPEADHLYMNEPFGQTWLPLFPFLIFRHCDLCQEPHFFFYQGVTENKALVYIDIMTGHVLSLREYAAMQALGRLFQGKSMYEEAIERYKLASELEPSSIESRNGTVLCHEKLGNLNYQKENFVLAIKHYEEALRLDPEIVRILFNLGLAYRKIKELDKAINLLTRIIQTYPKYHRATEILAYLYEEKGNNTKSLFYYNRFLRAEPKNQVVLERRKRLMARMEPDVQPDERDQTKISEDKAVSFEDLVTDLTLDEKTVNGRPIIGRENELRELCEILACMKKNSPLLVGEPGVGKTVLVEELARRLASGDVPAVLMNKRIMQLRPASLLAGTKFRGQFEERMLVLIKELKKRKNCILFIDDLHTIINSGMTKGGSIDASNALKPELAKGDIQIIGICTYDEYRLYLERDAAFERRFQVIRIEEPDDDICRTIIEGHQEELETFHNVRLSADAIKAAIDLPRLYLRDRYLPDKAIDLIDRTCSMIAAERDLATGESAADVPFISEQDVVRAVSTLTRIPIAKIAHTHSKRYMHMEEDLTRRVVGQPEAIHVVSQVIRTAKLEFDLYPERPDGVFLFVGPTGVGKTELARAMAEFLFGNEDKMLRVDMSEFTDDISTSKLIGITPGYVGYNDRNQLTDHVKNHPFSLILLDEIEKANRQVLNLFLQVFDSGRLTDGRGKTVYFNTTTFVMTSNIGADLFKRSKIGYNKIPTDDEFFHPHVSKGELLHEVTSFLPPEFINRIDEIVFFRTLTRDDIRTIARMQLEVIERRLQRDGKTLRLKDDALDIIVTRGYSEQFGARNLNRVIRKLLLDPLAQRSLGPEWILTDTIEVHALDEELVIE